jgi:Virulence factor
MAAELTVIWWRDIPAQVVARSGRTSARVQLANRFQEAIDMAATRVGLIGTDDYLAEWRRETRGCGEDLDAEAAAEAARLEQAFGDTALDVLVRAGGIAEGRSGVAEEAP